jgi:CPA2 family monovalent cation:H+ antiporter-2
MPEAGYLWEVIVLLAAAVVAVAFAYHLRLGPIMGYLVAGIAVGPHSLGLIQDLENTRALAELGIVFLLFTIGLELPLSRIRVTFGSAFLLGLAQVLITAAIFAGAAILAGLDGTAAIIIGAALALSSTAMVIRILVDRGELNSQFGRTAFAVLIVQDLAVAIFLVLVTALGNTEETFGHTLLFAGLKLVIAIAAILGVGRLVLRHVLVQVALVREREIFIALTLFIVLATGFLSHLAGLSMAFGAFLAGMLLAETPFRHQVAADIQPFRGLLLGLFFMTVGMTVDLQLVWSRFDSVLLLVLGLLIGKTAIIALLARLFGQSRVDALHLGLLLFQGGEFAFVLFAAAVLQGVLPFAETQILILVVALTMMLTPLIAKLAGTLAGRMEQQEAVPVDAVPDETEELHDHVVVIGFGRVGRAVATQLADDGRAFVAVDLDPHRIAQARNAGFTVYYGDATQPDILSSLHIERARTVVVTLDNPKAALQVVALIRYIFPELEVFARARNDQHARELEEAGAHLVVPELIQTGVKLASEVMEKTAMRGTLG